MNGYGVPRPMIRHESVTFDSSGTSLVGDLYLSYDHAPGVVVAGTWTSVKEMMADRYARRLAEYGYAVLSFDFTGFGASGGDPRDVESPARKMLDLRAALTFLAGLPAVDADRLGGLGICAGAMYMAGAAAQDSRIRALSLIAPWLHDASICEAVYGGAEAVTEKIELGQLARLRYEETGAIDYVPVVSGTDEHAAMPYDIDFYLKPCRGAVPNWPNRFAVMAWPEWLEFDAIALAPDVAQPTLIVHSDDAAIPDGARRFYAGLKGKKQILWTAGEQFDFYDQKPQVEFGVGAAAAHFGRIL